MLIITARRKLEAVYGTDGYQTIRDALNKYAAQANAIVFAVDDAEDAARLYLTAIAGSDSGSILLAIRAARARIGAIADSVLIIGGDSVVPHYRIANPVLDRGLDADTDVLTDNPYAAANEAITEYLAPTFPIGRIAHDGITSAKDFAALLERMENRGGETSTAGAGSTLVVTEDWIPDSQQVATALPEPKDWHISPGYQLDAGSRSDAGRSFLYFNLHGFPQDPDWKGYSTQQRNFVTAVSPSGIDRSYVSGAVAFAECCYGAQTAGRSPANSCALKFQSEGAAFVGSTGLAFSSYLAPGMFLDDADFMARAFFSGLMARDTVGVALRDARRAYLNFNPPHFTSVDWQCKQKTLLQFVLLGDPRWTM